MYYCSTAVTELFVIDIITSILFIDSLVMGFIKHPPTIPQLFAASSTSGIIYLLSNKV